MKSETAIERGLQLLLIRQFCVLSWAVMLLIFSHFIDDLLVSLGVVMLASLIVMGLVFASTSVCFLGDAK